MTATLRFTLACLLLLGVGALRGARAEEKPVQDIEAGATPGAFALNDQEGKAASLGSGQGHGWFLLAFFPKAATGG